MQAFIAAARRLVARLSTALVLGAAAARGWAAWQRHRRRGAERRSSERNTLPSLFDVHPSAGTAPRRAVGLQVVPIDRVVGTMRHPSQNTADFLPLPRLRGTNWRGRWQRITRALDGLAVLPPVELVQVGDNYYVADGHNRVAAARLAGAGEIDADVTQLIVPGVTRPGQATLDTSSLIGAAEVRQAGSGRQSRMVEQRTATDEIMRRDLLRGDEDGG